MDPNAITYFGETDARNKKIRFGIKAKDRLKHVYVIGKTGMGKSTLLENMAIQDIQNGNGIAFMDPHGGTAEKLLEYVPEHRIKDVLYFAPFDLEYPVSFNVMEDIGADKRHLVVNGLMSTFEKIWVDAWSARMAYILNNTLLALLEYPGATLLGVNRMLADKEYRRKIVENVKDPSVKAFWIEEFGKYTEKFAAEATPAIQNKVGQFTSNPLVRNLIGQSESTFDIRKFMDEKKIIIINLSKGRVGEGNANLIGSMLITKIYLAAMSRADSSEAELAKLPNFYLYVDEFQSFANKSFADILSEARKYKLNLTIAHQYIEQMEEEVRDAVFGNVGTMITFRVGAFDAEVLEKEFAPTFTAEDLVNLGFTQIYLKLMIDGVSSSPFSSTTMAPIPRPEISFRDRVVASSREQFARPRALVEQDISDWHMNGGAAPKLEVPGEKVPKIAERSVEWSEQRNVPRVVERIDQRVDVRQSFPKPAFQPDRPQNVQQNTPSRDVHNDNRNGSRDNPRRAPESFPQERRNAPVEAPRDEESFQESKIDANKLAFIKAAEVLAQAKTEPKNDVQDTIKRSEANTYIRGNPRENGEERTDNRSEVRQEKPRQDSISLNTLGQAGNKNPSIQNMSNLKNAIAEALKNKGSVADTSREHLGTGSPGPNTGNPRALGNDQPISPALMQQPKQPESNPTPKVETAKSSEPIAETKSLDAKVAEDKKEEKQENKEEAKRDEKKSEAPKSDFGPKTSSPYEIPEHVLKDILSMEEKK